MLVDSIVQILATSELKKQLQQIQGDNNVYKNNRFLIGGTQILSVGFLATHLALYSYNYEWWGEGDTWMINMSIGQILCAIYSFLACTWEKGTVLEILWYSRIGFAAIFLVEFLTMLTTFLAALFGMVLADHIGLYTISENLVSGIMLTLVPFSVLFGFTMCAVNSRYYEIFGEDRDYSVDKSHSFLTKKQADDLLSTYMQLPATYTPAQSQRRVTTP